MSIPHVIKYPYRSIMQQVKLIDNNFPVWYRNLRNVLENEDRLYVLDYAFPMLPPKDSLKEHWLKHHQDSQKVSFLILSSMSDEYPSDFRAEIAYFHAYYMIKEMEESFQSRRNWRFAILKEITKPMKFEHFVKDHVERLEGYFDRLEKLDYPLHLGMAINTIFISLPLQYEQFVKRYNKNVFGGTIAELKDMLVAAEKKMKAMNVVVPESSSKGKKRAHRFDEDAICYLCGEPGHWNCTGKSSRLVGSDASGLIWKEVDINEEDEY